MREANDAVRIDDVRRRNWKFIGVLAVAESDVVLEDVLGKLLQLLADLEDNAELPRDFVAEIAEHRKGQFVLLGGDDSVVRHLRGDGDQSRAQLLYCRQR